MSNDDTNPYQASGLEPKPVTGASQSIEYMRAIHYVFESPKWMMNLVWGSLCLLSTQVIPIVGQMVWMGYQFDVVENLLGNPGKTYPDFDTNKFKDYLIRGLWMFLVMLVLGLALLPVMLIYMGIFLAGIFGGAAVADGNESAAGIGIIILFAVMAVLGILLWIFMMIVMTPFMIRAGLTQDFRASFDLAWVKDFVRKMWLETLMSQLFLMAVALFAQIVGLLACFVGIFPAVAAVLLFQGHIFLQLYQVYLSRGGQKIPLKPSANIQPAKPV